MSRLLVGAAVLGIVGVGFAASASAGTRGGKKTAPNGQNLDELARESTEHMLGQDIAAIRGDVEQWKRASDPETAGALSFTLEQAVVGATLPESQLDGGNGSPVLRAFGLRVLQLEGRKDRVEMWAAAWDKILPALAAALRAKGSALSPKSADPVPDEATLRLISEAVLSGDPDRMRQVAARLDGLGFPEQAKDLRAMADLIERGKAKVDPAKPDEPKPPGPKPANDNDEPKPPAPKPAPPAPSPDTPAPPPPVATERVVVVRKGEGMFQVAQRLLGKSEGASRWKEMRAINVPPFRIDKKGNVIVNPGEMFDVPRSWPPHPDAIPGGSPGPGRQTTPKPSPSSPAPTPKPPSSATRLVVVKKGEGIFQVAQRLLGNSEGASRWKELRALNVPPFKQDKKGDVLLNPGDRLKVPADWPRNDKEETIGGDGRGMNPRQLKAARVALGAQFNEVEPGELMNFQQREGIEATGSYGPATAMVLCQRFRIVPPLPHAWGTNEPRARAKFARAMYREAKRDPQRADEFRLQARRAEGKAA